MLDRINSLERTGLTKLGIKYKVLGYLSHFNNPYVSDKYLRKSLIEVIEKENPLEAGINLKGGGRRKSKKKYSDTKKSKKQTSFRIDIKLKPIKSYYPITDNKIIAIGDIHGDLSVVIKTLKLGGVIDIKTPLYFDNLKDIENIKWTGGNTYVVQVGDQIDRCRPSNWYRDICADNDTYKDEGSDLKIMELLDYLDSLARLEGGRVISILGNHEIMNCVGDFRYVSPKEFEEFGEFFNIKKTKSPNRIFPYGYKERKQAFSPGGMIAKKFASNRNSIVQVGKWVFVHGGLTPKISNLFSLQEMNDGIRNWLLGKRDRKTKEVFEALYDDDENGIFWTREMGDLGNWDDIRSPKFFNKTLDMLNKKNDRDMDDIIEGIVMGHTPQYMNNKGINSSCNGKLWRVDIGASKAFGPCTNCENEDQFRKVAILEILNDKCTIIKEK